VDALDLRWDVLLASEWAQESEPQSGSPSGTETGTVSGRAMAHLSGSATGCE
jgi:hypothetical protein